ncbi:709_t:CDS:2 [Entrophospora sp. SA101]|nr:709_t:CDS:2 [Entrophospora sp. SA101]
MIQIFADENSNTSNETEVSDIELIETQNNVSIILDYDLENENNNNTLDVENGSTEFGSDNLYFENLEVYN